MRQPVSGLSLNKELQSAPRSNNSISLISSGILAYTIPRSEAESAIFSFSTIDTTPIGLPVGIMLQFRYHHTVVWVWFLQGRERPKKKVAKFALTTLLPDIPLRSWIKCSNTLQCPRSKWWIVALPIDWYIHFNVLRQTKPYWDRSDAPALFRNDWSYWHEI